MPHVLGEPFGTVLQLSLEEKIVLGAGLYSKGPGSSKLWKCVDCFADDEKFVFDRADSDVAQEFVRAEREAFESCVPATTDEIERLRGRQLIKAFIKRCLPDALGKFEFVPDESGFHIVPTGTINDKFLRHEALDQSRYQLIRRFAKSTGPDGWTAMITVWMNRQDVPFRVATRPSPAGDIIVVQRGTE